jgi:4-diphosphocytidyl-2C-methyl-D-erythritol kinase
MLDFIFTVVLAGMKIHLDKKVPTGAGLGGGSSNAATALWAANQFSGGIASEKDLQEWSAEIGSDIPFFFSRGAAYCTGRGEVCHTLFVIFSFLNLGNMS